MQLPGARNAQILVQEAGSELLVYDSTIKKTFHLNETAKNVYQACGAKLTFNELKERYKYTDELIYLTLSELKRNDLIEGEASDTYPAVTRREAAKRVGLATMIVLPLITSIVAPTAARAQSSTPSTVCNIDAVCSCSVTNNDTRPRVCDLDTRFDGLGGTATGCNSNASSCLCFVNSKSSTGVCRFITF